MHNTTIAAGRQRLTRDRLQIQSLSAIYARAAAQNPDSDYYRRAARVYQCCADVWEVTMSDGTVTYDPAYRCGDRLCPSCARSRSMRVAANASDVAAYLRQTGQYRTPYHVVLTVRNVPSDALGTCIDHMISACRWMFRRRSIAALVAGWGRNIEVTYNPTRRDYHPHVHMLVIPASDDAPEFISQSSWWSIQWADALNACGVTMDYMPICRSDAAYSDGVLPEVSKYITKLTRIYQLRADDRYNAVVTIDQATRGRKLISYGGIWAAARRELRQRDDIDAGDNTAIRACVTRTYLSWAGLEHGGYLPIATMQ